MEESNIYQSFGLRLARLRQARGLSQQRLAELLSVTRQAVSNWERGQTVPDLGTLDRLCQVLEVDWNRLCGGAEPRRRFRYAPVLAAGALVLAVLVLAGISPKAPAEDPPVQASWALRGEVLRSHQVTAMAAGPHGLQKEAAQLLAERLEALEAEEEPAELTAELRQSFDLAGEACEFRFLPAYEGGVFADRNEVLTWLYRGPTRGAVPTTEQVDGWLAAWFDPSCQWEHGSTEDYRLTEEGVYLPHSAYSGRCDYALEALERREEGGFQVVLEIRETSGTGETLPARLLTLELTAEAGQLQFSRISWEEAPI